MLISCLFLQAAQHFLELDLHRLHQLKGYKFTKKADVVRLDAEVFGLREALASKEKELADLKNSHLAEVNSLRQQMANLQIATEALKTVKEEASKAAEDKFTEMERLKRNHNSIISLLGEAHPAKVFNLRGA